MYYSPSAPGALATVLVGLPQLYTTVTNYRFITAPVTATLPPASQGATYGAFTTAEITTMTPASQDGVATVVVQVPQSYTTLNTDGYFSNRATAILAPASQGDPATVVIQVAASYTTVTSYSTGFSGSSTSTGPVPTDGSPATVCIVLPAVGTQIADQTCGNTALEYAIYTHNYYNSDPPNFSSFNAESFKSKLPSFTGITDRIGIPYCDEITLVWFGDKAMTSWTRSNADLEQGYSWGPSASKTYKIQLTAGTYTPFRLLWANAQGDYGMIVTVTAPDGTAIVDGSGSKND
ncbi:Agglutinin 2 [Fusarium agapanthi]|uniref:Agglutinin 2 n=1 Tax=Fusarium agapanthi TaxID=1803897 RepID=A0A9P5AZK7_9HYPO|nr:Agglutinin 2 [Fusarium agapanthi]